MLSTNAGVMTSTKQNLPLGPASARSNRMEYLLDMAATHIGGYPHTFAEQLPALLVAMDRTAASSYSL